MKKLKIKEGKFRFGDIVYLKKQLTGRLHFENIPVGTKAVVVNAESVGVYCATVAFDGFVQQVLTERGHLLDFPLGYVHAEDISRYPMKRSR